MRNRGVIAGIIPTTNPTSTAIFKTLIALKTRNGIITLDSFCMAEPDLIITFAVKSYINLGFTINSYTEHALEVGSASKAVSYVEIISTDGSSFIISARIARFWSSSIRSNSSSSTKKYGGIAGVHCESAGVIDALTVRQHDYEEIGPRLKNTGR